MKLIKDMGNILNGRKTKRRWGIYECPKCKKHFEVQSSNVKAGKSKMCRTCSASICNITHGHYNHKLYTTWMNMKSRCYNVKNKRYEIYGGEGVTVCDEWRNDFKIFYDWAIANGYHEDLTIDKDMLCNKQKINPKIYSPKTCCFVTKTENSRATRILNKSNTSGYRGVSYHKDKKKFITQISVDSKKIQIGTFTNKLDAAHAYDNYVKEHNLEHTINFTNEETM